MANSNFKQDILDSVGEQQIESVIILSEINDYIYGEPDSRDTPELKAVIRVPTSWNEAAPMLDYTYDTGFGGMDCHNIVVFTAEDVYYIHEYDGATDIYSVPRNPRILK